MKSFWHEVDVAIVGGGMAGLTTAFLLKRAGWKVAVFSPGKLGASERGLTGAYLTALQERPFRTLTARLGREGARRIALAGMQAIDQLERLARGLGVDCGFERLPAYLFTEDSEGRAELSDEVHAARDAGLDVSFVREVPLPFEVAAAIRVEDQARFDPVRFLSGLAEEIEGGGSYVFADTPVSSVLDGVPCEVVTARGTVSAKRVVGATDAETLRRLFGAPKVARTSSSALALRFDHELDGLFFDAAAPHHCLRTWADAEGPLLIAGGVGGFAELEDWLRRRFEAGPIGYLWSGEIEWTMDGVPYVGRNGLGSNVFLATGFAGNTMVNGTIAGMVICDWMLGRENPYARLLGPRRIPASAPSFLQPFSPASRGAGCPEPPARSPRRTPAPG